MESDLSAFHRIDDVHRMGSRRWARLVPRLFAYAGAVQMRVRMESEQQSDPVPVEPVPAAGGGVPQAADGTPLLAGPPSPHGGGEVVEASRAALQFSDIGDMFSFGG